MKHGHKAKEAETKALDKDRTAKTGKGSSSKKGIKTGGTKIPIAKKTAGKEAAGKEAGKQAVVAAKADQKGRPKGNDAVAFSSPAVASAFRRAVKKYATALKRLTD